jgi:prepilin-type N-terminal cleavage/methylation domain-containing protein
MIKMTPFPPSRRQRGFSLIEVLVVISIIGILAGLTITALSGVGGVDENLRSRNNMRQIHTWIENYAANHRDRVVPSQFDYFAENGLEVGKVACRTGYTVDNGDEVFWPETNNLLHPTGDPRMDFVAQGSWADILWVDSNLGDDAGVADFPLVQPGGGFSSNQDDIMVSYRYRAPDRHLYDFNSGFNKNPLRSLAVNTYNAPMRVGGLDIVVDNSQIGEGGLGLPRPYGSGAWEKGNPGFFAANNFFDARSDVDRDPGSGGSTIDRFVSKGQLTAPAESMFLVDSFAGLVIGGGPDNEQATSDAFLIDAGPGGVGVLGSGAVGGGAAANTTQEIDFRYGAGDACLMLFLDGHVEVVSRFGGVKDLQGITGGVTGRGIRVTDLDRRKSEAP